MKYEITSPQLFVIKCIATWSNIHIYIFIKYIYISGMDSCYHAKHKWLQSTDERRWEMKIFTKDTASQWWPESFKKFCTSCALWLKKRQNGASLHDPAIDMVYWKCLINEPQSTSSTVISLKYAQYYATIKWIHHALKSTIHIKQNRMIATCDDKQPQKMNLQLFNAAWALHSWNLQLF